MHFDEIFDECYSMATSMPAGLCWMPIFAEVARVASWFYYVQSSCRAAVRPTVCTSVISVLCTEVACVGLQTMLISSSMLRCRLGRAAFEVRG
jgi:hypothetical protein